MSGLRVMHFSVAEKVLTENIFGLLTRAKFFPLCKNTSKSVPSGFTPCRYHRSGKHLPSTSLQSQSDYARVQIGNLYHIYMSLSSNWSYDSSRTAVPLAVLSALLAANKRNRGNYHKPVPVHRPMFTFAMTLHMNLPDGLESAMRLHLKAGPIQALHVFDFDLTLIRTPDQVAGAAVYLSATGHEWPFKGWWGREESLLPPVVPTPLPESFIIRSVFDELEDITVRAQTAAAIVVTGRMQKLRSSVLRILHEAARAHQGEESSFLSDEVVFNHPGGSLSTINYKTALIETIIDQGPPQLKNVKEIHIWEDRKEHARIFATEFASKMFERAEIDTVVHFVAPKTP